MISCCLICDRFKAGQPVEAGIFTYSLKRLPVAFRPEQSQCYMAQPSSQPFLCNVFRPNEGSLRFNVEFSPMASPNFEPGRPTENANELARLIERGLRETKAVDLEALCVLAGRKVRSACFGCFQVN